MLQSKLFGKTSKTAPKDADSVNAALLTQAGFIHKVGAGIYEFLPLGLRVLDNIENIIRDEMDGIGAQEVSMPVLHPINYYQTTGRDKTMNDILFRSDGHGSVDYAMGPSHEEIVTPLVANYVQSYKDLPLALYQIQLKFRNEPRAKSGLLRGREFGMKDMYSFHDSQESLDEFYEKAKQAYLEVYKRCDLEAMVVEAGGGAFTDQLSHEFQVACPAGEDTILVDSEGKAQNFEVVQELHEAKNPEEKEEELESKKVDRDLSVEANAKAHGVEAWKILKTVVFKLESGNFIGVCIRGDLEIEHGKLEKYLGAKVFTASPAELKELGLVQGFISPVENEKLEFIGDISLKTVKNFITGANQAGIDYLNVNLGRDFQVKDLVHLSDVTKIDGWEEIKAVEAGNIFKLGTKYSEPCKLSINTKDGQKKDVIMGCYGIGTSRLMGTIAEVHHDEKGLVWPQEVAPFLIHLVHLGQNEEVIEAAQDLYKFLRENGYDVLYDDRDLGPGVKLADSDLIGIPMRIVLGNKTIEEKACEVKMRNEEEAKLVTIEELKSQLIDY